MKSYSFGNQFFVDNKDSLHAGTLLGVIRYDHLHMSSGQVKQCILITVLQIAVQSSIIFLARGGA